MQKVRGKSSSNCVYLGALHGSVPNTGYIKDKKGKVGGKGVL